MAVVVVVVVMVKKVVVVVMVEEEKGRMEEQEPGLRYGVVSPVGRKKERPLQILAGIRSIANREFVSSPFPSIILLLSSAADAPHSEYNALWSKIE